MMKEFQVIIYNEDGSYSPIKATLNLSEVVMFQEYSNDKTKTHVLLRSGQETIIDEMYDSFKLNFKHKGKKDE